jgi:tyrosyl-tRNA synthetase
MKFLEELAWRGMIHDMTPGLEDYLENDPDALAYIGFDPTAPSLTIGNYVQLMLLTIFQKHGFKPVVLMGGATGRIGDPSGRDTERELKSYEEVDRNLSFQKSQCEKLLTFGDSGNQVVFYNNYDFYKNMNVLDFLRDVGKSLSINYMLAKDSVKNRLETGLSFTEFSYQLLQGYDYQTLYSSAGCKLQMGGSDQWGNIVSGTEMIRRNLGQKAYALTTPLLTKADGTKFGKSSEGNLWLDSKLTSPYRFYQFWINADDRDIEKYLKYFSLKSVDEMETIIQSIPTDPRIAKAQLAEELTRRVHSDEEFESVLRVSEIIFNPRLDLEALQQLQLNDWISLIQEIPSIGYSEVTPIEVVDLLVTTEICTSKSEARRAIQQNAISVNKQKVATEIEMIKTEHWIRDKFLFIENGKKNKFVVYKP